MQICWLIRHGQSRSNAGELTVDEESTSLTSLGEEQAAHFAAYFTAVPDLIVVSPYVRTQQTAMPFRERFPTVPVEMWPVHEFSGLAPTRYHQTRASERRPWVRDFWAEADPDFVDGAGAESFTVGLVRVADFLTRLQSHPAEQIVVFTHGRFLQLVYWVWLMQDLAQAQANKQACHTFFRSFQMPNTAVVTGYQVNQQLLLSPPYNTYLPPALRG